MSSNVRDSISSMDDDPLVELIVQICFCRTEEAKRLLAISGNDVSSAVALFQKERNEGQNEMPIREKLRMSNVNNRMNRVMRTVETRQQEGEGSANDSVSFLPRGGLSSIIAGPSTMSVTGQAMPLHRRRTKAHHPVPSASKLALRLLANDLLGSSIDLLYAGTLNCARQCAESRLKWLVVHIQCDNFQSHTIEDDVLVHKDVKNLLRRCFVLWQLNSGTIEGRRFLTTYHCPRQHHFCVIDPISGEEIWTFSNPNVKNVLAGLQQVLEIHGEFLQIVSPEELPSRPCFKDTFDSLSHSLNTIKQVAQTNEESPTNEIPLDDKLGEELTMLKLHFFNASGENESTVFHWSSDTKLQLLRLYISEQLQHIPQNDYKLICLQPRLILDSKHNQFSLKMLGLHPSANLHLTWDN